MGTSASGITIDVDIDAVEEFMQIFEQLQALQTSAHGSVNSTHADGLGKFDDAVQLAAEHARHRADHLARLKRLMTALRASERSTAQVIVDYEETDDAAKYTMDAFLAILGGGGGGTAAAADGAPGMIAGSGPKEG